MPRELQAHRINLANDTLRIQVLDEPGVGGAHHHYKISGFNTATNASDPFIVRHGAAAEYATLLFQNGPIPDKGVNGITHEALLAILMDRLESFQAGPYACAENEEALLHIREAMHALHTRTHARMQRGVEGTHVI